MSVKVKTGASTWTGFVPHAKTASNTWTQIQKTHVKTGASTWTQVYSIQNIRPNASSDTVLFGAYYSINPSNAYDGSTGDTSTYMSNYAVSSDYYPSGQANNGEGYTEYTFASSSAIRAVVNIKYKRTGTGGGQFGSAAASLKLDTGAGFSVIATASNTSYDASYQTYQGTFSITDRNQIKIRVYAVENYWYNVTAAGDPPTYDEGYASAAFLISDIYTTFYY